MKKKIFLLTIALLCAVAQGAWAESENVTFNVRYWDTTNKQVVTTETTKEATVLTSYNDWVPKYLPTIGLQPIVIMLVRIF